MRQATTGNVGRGVLEDAGFGAPHTPVSVSVSVCLCLCLSLCLISPLRGCDRPGFGGGGGGGGSVASSTVASAQSSDSDG